MDFALLERTGVTRSPLRLNLFDDTTFDAKVEVYEYASVVSAWSWVGNIPGYSFSSVSLVFSSQELLLTGTVTIPPTYPRNYYQIRRVVDDATGLHILREFDPQRYPGDPVEP